jgi:hypothetical protein
MPIAKAKVLPRPANTSSPEDGDAVGKEVLGEAVGPTLGMIVHTLASGHQAH